VRVQHDEGVANHIGPEPCGDAREGVGEASAGECTGQPLSRERMFIPGADAVNWAEGDTSGATARVPTRSGVVGDPGMCRRSLCGNREISRLADCSLLPTAPVRIGKARSRSR
jgi:hypothetical protein